MCVSVDVCLCAHLRVSVSVYFSVRLCVCMCVCACVFLCLCMSLCHNACLEIGEQLAKGVGSFLPSRGSWGLITGFKLGANVFTH